MRKYNAFCHSLERQIEIILFTEFPHRSEIIGVYDINTLVQASADVNLTDNMGNTPQEAREEERKKNENSEGQSGERSRSNAD